MTWRAGRRAGRGGNYALISLLTVPVIIGFGALAVDTTYMRLARTQAQDVADAASTAAMYRLRRTRDRGQATQAALDTCAVNVVVGEAPLCEAVRFGEFEDGEFVEGDSQDAVQVVVSRREGIAPDLFFSRIWGYSTFDVAAQAVAESRTLDIVLVVDITISWRPAQFEGARSAAIALLDTVEETAGEGDKIGMVVFNGPFAWEFTPMTSLTDAGSISDVRSDWSDLALASLAGDPADCPWPTRCNSHKFTGDQGSNFTDPAGGFYPNMPRNYPREPNTDYYPGLLMAEQMFDEGNEDAFRAMVILTDGAPYRVPGNVLDKRTAAGYVETRWREVMGPIPHSNNAIVSDSIALSTKMWDEQRTHTWLVSFVKDNASLQPIAPGQGYYDRVTSPVELVQSFQTIAESLPIVITD